MRLKGFLKKLILKKINKYKSINSFKSSNNFKQKKLPPRIVKKTQHHWRIYHNQYILLWIRCARQHTNKLVKDLLQIWLTKVHYSIKTKMYKPWREGCMTLWMC